MFRIKKKLLLFILCILTCCTVISSCSFTSREETTQSSKSKRKKKSKKKKKKDKDKSENKSENKKEAEKQKEKISKLEKEFFTLDDAGERERLKTKLAKALDDFLSSDYTNLVSTSEGKELDYSLFETKLTDENKVIYFISVKDPDTEEKTDFLTDGEDTYINSDDTGWQKYEKDIGYVDVPITGADYISYISFIYAALDAGVDYKYYPDDDLYYIEVDKEAVKELDLKTINSRINNADKLDVYDFLIRDNEDSIKTYYPDNDVVGKDYLFSFIDERFSAAEVEYNEIYQEIGYSFIMRLELEDDEKDIIELFNKLKNTDFEDFEDNEEDISGYQLLKYY